MPSFKLLPGNRLSRSEAANLIAAPESIAGASISPKWERLSRSVPSNRNDFAAPILPKRESERTNFRSILVKRDSAFVIAKGKLVLGESRRELLSR